MGSADRDLFGTLRPQIDRDLLATARLKQLCGFRAIVITRYGSS